MNLPIFAMEALTEFRTVGAVAPSSRYLTRAMLGPLTPLKPRVVVELGPGTGAITQALLDVLPRNAVLIAFEINARFCRYLKAKVSDPRLLLLNASAKSVREELRLYGHERVDAVVSSLALSLMPEGQRRALLGQMAELLEEGGVFTQYQYLHALQLQNWRVKRFSIEKLLAHHFELVERKTIWRNLPPASVCVCRSPRRIQPSAAS